MSRSKSRQNVEVCGDCGAFDATWASLNKGILLCTQCCSVHRSLGRHISQVKSLQKSTWSKHQLDMIHTLNNNGANNVWEHALLENSSKLSKKKPHPGDTLNTKAEFIKAKHLQCSFAPRPNSEDGLLSVENELGKQLHGSVRTPNLETSFRLLAYGADPNYFHDEKGTTPLHVAVKSDQKLQVELLLVHGANPNCPDAKGKTPIDYARYHVNQDLANRLIESQYELTDTFSFYLTLRKPDHQNGIHFLIPQAGFKSNPASLAKLQRLPNYLFEELAMDVYDEVDRRETEAIWLSCVDAIELSAVPFLPVNPTLSTTRNQGRQKLARFSTPELKSLVYDILIDTQRRQFLAEKGLPPHLREFSQVSDDDPLYDSVASDEEYAALPPVQEQNAVNKSVSPEIISTDQNSISTNIDDATYMLEHLTKKLQDSDNLITDLKAENDKLRIFVENLKSENSALKSRLSHNKFNNEDVKVNGEKGHDSLDSVLVNQAGDAKAPLHHGWSPDNNPTVDLRNSLKPQRPSSMYETREGLKIPNWHAVKKQIKMCDHHHSRNTTHGGTFSSPQDPQVVMQCTEQITRSIQQLVKCIHETNKEDCIAHAEKVKMAVSRLATILPQESDGEIIKMMLNVLHRLGPECIGLQNACKNNDFKRVEHHLMKTRECAFHLAKYTKEIVTKYSVQ